MSCGSELDHVFLNTEEPEMIYLTLFWTFIKIGLFTIGGGYAMIPLIQQEVIERHGWMTIDQFTEFVGIAESTPGSFAINIATFVGVHAAQESGGHGILGSLCTTGGVVLPSLIIILIIAGLFHYAMQHWLVRSALTGAKPVVVGLIGAAGFTLTAHTLSDPTTGFHWTSAGLAIGLMLITAITRLNAVFVILIGAVGGLLLFGVLDLPS